MRRIAEIASYHAHVYFDAPSRDAAGSAVVATRAALGLMVNTRFLNVWVERPDGWKIVAWQATRLAEPA